MAKPRVVQKTGVMKSCYRCKAVKDASEFHRYARNRDGRQPYCRPCKKLIDREHNRRNPRRNYAHTRQYKLRNKKWLYEYLKAKKCEWEGCMVDDPDMLVFDHINPSEKRDHVSSIAHSSWSLRSLQEEVAKCRVLCANHHQKHTIQQFGYKKWLADI